MAKTKTTKSTPKPKPDPNGNGGGRWQNIWDRLNTNQDEKTYLVENLSLLVSAGMDMYTALAAIEMELRSKGMKRLITQVKREVDSGLTLAEALKKSKLLPAHIIALIEVGEGSGRLPENLRVIALQQQKDREFASRLRSAMLYPVFVIILTVIIGLGITWFILPRLSQVFSQLKVDLPLVTRFFIGVGDFVNSYGTIVIPVSGALFILLIYIVFFSPRTKASGQWLLFKVPGIRQLIKDVELARMGYILGTLLEAGIPIVEAIDSLRDVARFYRFTQLYTHLRDEIEDGASFQKSFASFKNANDLVPVPIQQMIVAAEQSGTLSATLLRVGQAFEERTQTASKNLAVILEPILLIIVWIGVVAVALAVILPIYSLIGSLETAPGTAQSQEDAPAEETIIELPVTEETPPPTETDAMAPKDLVTPPPAEPAPTGERTPTGELTTTESELSVRTEPSPETGDTLRVVGLGERFPYFREEDGWYEILLTDGTTGWIFGQYVELQE